MNTDIHSHTPQLAVIDSRGLPVRQIAYWRQDAGELITQARVNRTVFDPAGRAIAQWDPRLFQDTSAPANLSTLHGLSGVELCTRSVDAGWRVNLLGEAGAPMQSWDGRGSRRSWEYDDQLRPLAVFEQAAVGEAFCTERMVYGVGSQAFADHNQCGQLIRHDDPAGTCHFSEFGLTGALLDQQQHFLQALDSPDWPLPVNERDALLEPGAGAHSTFHFNPLGELLEQTDAQGNRQRFNQTVDGQLRDAWLHLNHVPKAQRLVSGIDYNAQGQIERQTAGNGVVSQWDYCAKDGRLIRLHAKRANGEPLQELNYGYDPVGNILSIEDKALPIRYFANQRIEPINRYGYDSLYQLIEATGWEAGSANKGPSSIEDPQAVANYRQTYRYDAGGNLLELIHHGPQQHGRRLTAAKHSNRCLPERNGRPPTEAEIAVGFDDNGNLQALEPGRILSWDTRNQLHHVSPVERASELNDTERYIYGADGMRQRKVRSTQTSARTVISETRYLPGLEVRNIEGEVLHVITAQAGGATVQVLHWETRVPKHLGNDPYRYSLADHLGSCALELDSEARIISREIYHPYGSTAFSDQGDSSEESYRTLRYSGKERDATGLYYYGFRYYVPWMQRWVNPDPFGAVDGINLYRMVRNSPVTFHDEEGAESVREYFDEKDIEGFSSVFSSIQTGLSAQGMDPSKVLYLMVGRSPQTLGMFIEQKGYTTALLQMSGISSSGAGIAKLADLSDRERANRSSFIEAAINGKDAGMQAIVMMDFSVTGNSISRSHQMLSEYYKSKGSSVDIKMAVVSRYTDAPEDSKDQSILHSHDNVLFNAAEKKGYLQMQERGVLRYLKIQQAEVDKGMSYTDKFNYKNVDEGKRSSIDPDKRFGLGLKMKGAIEQYPNPTPTDAKNIKRQRYGIGMISNGVSGVDVYINAHNKKRQTWFQRVFS